MVEQMVDQQQDILSGTGLAAIALPLAPRLQVKDLACQRGLRPVFTNLNFTLEPGAALALYGANGSGKTSLLRQLAGLLPLMAGTISGLPERHYLGHADGLKNALRVDESVRFEAAMLGSPFGKAQLDAHMPALLAAFGLKGRGAQKVGDLSAGQRRRLSLARLRVAPRPLWLLDEPLTALDANAIALVSDLAAAHLAHGGSIIAASHVPLSFANQSLTLGEN